MYEWLLKDGTNIKMNDYVFNVFIINRALYMVLKARDCDIWSLWCMWYLATFIMTMFIIYHNIQYPFLHIL